MSVIIVLYAQANTLHSFVHELRSMEARPAELVQAGVQEPSLRIVQLTIDGETW